jgi:alpha-beta hydrolase superfamily lysophospholipase
MRPGRRAIGARLMAAVLGGLVVAGGAFGASLVRGASYTTAGPPAGAAATGATGPTSTPTGATGPTSTPTGATGPTSAPPPRPVHRRRFAVGLRVLRLVEPGRRIRLGQGKTRPRTLVTYVRYPALGAASGSDLPRASADRSGGPYPLVVFGHGFKISPRPYARLLSAWARAGFVVAAPVFPLGNAHAPGGPNRADIVNQPGDMSFVISRLLAASAKPRGPLSGLIGRKRVAVAGHSDGAATALAVGYNPRFRDRRVRATVILSGAELPGVGGLTFPRPSPPMLAAQGTADTLNLPRSTRAFYDRAPAPKYLLSLLGAGHLPPYTREGPQLRVIERVTVAFLDRYLKRSSISAHRILSLGRVPGISRMEGRP